MSEEYTRRCKDWIESFNQWTLPRSEAPVSFHNWTALYCLSAALRRHVSVGQRYLGGWTCYPHLYIFFVAPAGKAKKSTTMTYAADLIELVPHLVKVPDVFTTPILLQKLAKAEENAIYVLSSEFANLFQKTGPDIYDVLTDIFDGRKKIEGETISRGIEFSHRPVINLLAATTPEWLSANMSEAVIGGGFASRVLFIFESQSRRRQLYYPNLDHGQLDKLKDDLVSDLTHISTLMGEFCIEPDALTFMEEWYDINAEISKPGIRTAGFYQRKPKHIHTVAMLKHLSYSDSLVITRSDFQSAIELVEAIEPNLNEAFKRIGGQNKYALVMEGMVDYVYEKKRVRTLTLMKHFQSSAEPKLLQELLQAVISTNQIKQDGVGWLVPGEL